MRGWVQDGDGEGGKKHSFVPSPSANMSLCPSPTISKFLLKINVEHQYSVYQHSSQGQAQKLSRTPDFLYTIFQTLEIYTLFPQP